MDESKIRSALFFFVGNYFVTFFLIGLIAAGISLLNKPKPLQIAKVSEALLSYHLLFAIGINNLINFVLHVFFGDVATKFIGWENSPFQAEVGFASLGVGIAAKGQPQWFIFAAAFMISACTTGMMSAM